MDLDPNKKRKYDQVCQQLESDLKGTLLNPYYKPSDIRHYLTKRPCIRPDPNSKPLSSKKSVIKKSSNRNPKPLILPLPTPFVFQPPKDLPSSSSIQDLPSEDPIHQVDRTWLSGTSTKNYFLKDQLLDYFKYHQSSFIRNNPSLAHYFNHSRSFDNKYSVSQITPNPIIADRLSEDSILMKLGREFESMVYAHIKQIYPIDRIVDLRSNHRPWETIRYEETLRALKSGMDILIAPVLHDSERKLYGEIDILIRSDRINKIFPKTPNPPRHGSVYSKNYHYQVIDVKYRSLILFADGQSIRNCPLIRAYKSQLYIYTQLLAKHQEYDPKTAYILGRGWSFTSFGIKYEGRNCMEKLGLVHFSKDVKNNDHYIVKETETAIQKLQDLIQNGQTWNIRLDNLHKWSNLRPNMKNNYDFGFHEIKKYIAEQTADPTLLYYCNTENRRHAERLGIFRYDDPKCTAKALGKKPKNKDYTILNEMLQLSRDKNQLIRPELLSNKTFSQLFASSDKKSDRMIFYVDFETNSPILDTFESFPMAKRDVYIVMIGVGWLDADNNWSYRHFTVDRICWEEELKIAQEFTKFIYDKTENPILVHWAPAEASLWSRCFQRHYNALNPTLHDQWTDISERWYDLLKVFKSEPIIVKGSFNFSIKTIAKQMAKYGMIKNCYSTDLQCHNGLEASNLLTQMDQKLKTGKSKSIQQDPQFNSIMKYNEMDCRVMADIIQYLVEHYYQL